MYPTALPSQSTAVHYGSKDLRLEDRTLWSPQAGQAQVAVLATGLCGSDLHYCLHGRNGDFALQAPFVLGHEASGVVTAVGPGVKSLVVGQRVAIEAGIMCNKCGCCTAGGVGGVLHAARRAQVSKGQTVLVFGVGAIGLLACSVAQSMGASNVAAIDINQPRLDFAKNNAALLKFDEPDGFGVVFECTGAEPCIQMSIHAAISGGKVMFVGMGAGNVMVPLSTAAVREVDIQGAFRYANIYPVALALFVSGKLKNIDALVTHRFSLERTAEAFDLLARGKDADSKMVLKVMIGPSP
ncbi:chaperonin 10-like protein [Mycena vulgaris]|nr:chaperonin 10-like protein [Mycena vulgaris]